MAFSRLFPGVINHTYSYNGAGFGQLMPIDDLIAVLLGGASGYDGSKIANLYNAEGLEIVTSDFIFSQPGLRIGVFGENRAHSIVELTDTLAVYDLFARIDGRVSVEGVSLILEAGSNTADLSLERTMQAVGRLYDYTFDTSPEAWTRDDFYRSLIDLRALIDDNPERRVVSLSGKTTDFILEQATNDIAYRYALVHLNPFVITGDEALYIPHHENDALDLYGPFTGKGDLTPQYLQDRTAFLAEVLAVNAGDGSLPYARDHGQAIYYEDKTTGSQIHLGPGLSADDVPAAPLPEARRILFGSAAGETLTGGAVDDHLFGDAGNDTLDGGPGADILQGGSGNDTYLNVSGGDLIFDSEGGDTYYLTGDITATLTDGDGLGRVIYGSGDQRTSLVGGLRREDDSGVVYASVDGKFTYTLASSTLTVNLVGSSNPEHKLTINDFTSGDLGIELHDLSATPIEVQGSSGDEFLELHADNRLEVREGTVLGHEGETSIQYPGEVLRLFGHGGSDTMYILSDRPGLIVYGDGMQEQTGDGRDFIYLDFDGVHSGEVLEDTSNGAIVFAGGGDDLVDGSRRDDWLLGGSGHDEVRGYYGQDRLFGGLGNDLLDGMQDDNTVQGDAGDDRLFSENSLDYLYGEFIPVWSVVGNDTLEIDKQVRRAA
jgi:hypothetical protein